MLSQNFLDDLPDLEKRVEGFWIERNDTMRVIPSDANRSLLCGRAWELFSQAVMIYCLVQNRTSSSIISSRGSPGLARLRRPARVLRQRAPQFCSRLGRSREGDSYRCEGIMTTQLAYRRHRLTGRAERSARRS